MIYYTEKIDGLTPTFRDAVEVFIPKWLDSLLPHYQVAKEYKVDILFLANVIGTEGKHFEHDGYYYYYQNSSSGMSVLSLDGKGHYKHVNWRECMADMYPGIDRDPDPYMGKFCELNQNSQNLQNYSDQTFFKVLRDVMKLSQAHTVDGLVAGVFKDNKVLVEDSLEKEDMLMALVSKDTLHKRAYVRYSGVVAEL